MKFDEVSEPLKKVLKVLYKDRELLAEALEKYNISDKNLNVENLEFLSKKRFFEDNSMKFDITLTQGFKIRGYFEDGAEKRDYDIIPELHSSFKSILGRENSDYIKQVNMQRLKAKP